MKGLGQKENLVTCKTEEDAPKVADNGYSAINDCALTFLQTS